MTAVPKALEEELREAKDEIERLRAKIDHMERTGLRAIFLRATEIGQRNASRS